MIDEIMSANLAREGEIVVRTGPGRHATTVRFNAEAALVCGVDLGGTNCRIVVADAMGNSLIRGRFATPRDSSAAELGSWIARHVHSLVAKTASGSELGAVAIGVPGAVSGDRRRVVGSHNLGQILGEDFIREVTAALGVPTRIENDSNLALLGELRYGELAEDQTTVLFALGTGLGSAVSLDGGILAGETGLLGEFGRLPVPGSSLRLRDLLSGAGLLATARARGYVLDSAREIFDHPENFGDLESEIHAGLRHLVSIIALAYEPRTVLFTGGFSESLAREVFSATAAAVEEAVGVRATLRHADLEDSAGLLGALAASLEVLYGSLGVTVEHLPLIHIDQTRVVESLHACPLGA
ncbi:ROK family protein [Mycetocola spongiae]|uniref:ROK family protein n=1 Tax=Mycetocola spongiae TaxID=2859226 RepID=UPI001CF167C5|nr:ROK family protein [Mycetocola spongiae]UCR89743.1 ROK family protein [Mycetocola spongiae]